MARASMWSAAELEELAAHPELSSRELSELLPGRSSRAIGNKRARGMPGNPALAGEQPRTREPGDYLETLSAYLVDEFDCLEIWLKWNGYVTCRELTRNRLGWVTLLCTAKG